MPVPLMLFIFLCLICKLTSNVNNEIPLFWNGLDLSGFSLTEDSRPRWTMSLYSPVHNLLETLKDSLVFIFYYEMDTGRQRSFAWVYVSLTIENISFTVGQLSRPVSWCLLFVLYNHTGIPFVLSYSSYTFDLYQTHNMY